LLFCSSNTQATWIKSTGIYCLSVCPLEFDPLSANNLGQTTSCYLYLSVTAHESSPSATASAQRIRNSVPAQQVPAWQLEQQPTVQTFPEVEYLRAPKPKTYLLDSGDVLGVFLEGLLGRPGDAPPVHFPPESSSLGPSIGFPFVVQENGTVSLPAVDPIPVRGLTIEQAEGLIKSVYTGAGRAGSSILTGQSKVIVTLQRKRTINVIVVRQDNSSSSRPRGTTYSML